MLTELIIRNYLLIKDIKLDFTQGLNVFTGETGSGKSVVLSSLESLFGSKLGSDKLGQDSQEAYIEASFKLNESIREFLKKEEFLEELEESDGEQEFTISREISQKGSKARINGKISSVKTLKELGNLLFEFHGQTGNELLSEHDKQIEHLDSSFSLELKSKLKDYKEKFAHRKSLLNELHSRNLSAMNVEKELDYVNFQLNELEQAKLDSPEEEDELKQKIEVVSNLEASMELSAELREVFFESEQSISTAISGILKKLVSLSKKDLRLKEFLEELSGSYSAINSSINELISYFESLGEIESNVDALNERLDFIQKLKRKHKAKDLNEVIKILEGLELRKAELENFSDDTRELGAKIKNIESELKEIALILSQERKRIAREISEKVSAEMEKLKMKGLSFRVLVESEESLNERGQDKVEFLLDRENGESKPVGKVASGGEKSRLSLLLRATVGNNKTMIFDEIDSGTSGEVAERIGNKLSEIGSNQQVICITHQPLVACNADLHYVVSKKTEDQNQISVKKLKDDDEKIQALLDLMTSESENDRILAFGYAESLIKRPKTKD